MKPRRSELVPILVKLSGKLSAKRFSKEVAGYLLDKNMTDELDSLTRDMVSYRAESGVVEVNTVSAHQLSGAALKEVRGKVKQLYPSARQIIINQRIDQDQIGGVRLELPDQQLDLSIRGKLNRFKQLTVDV
jgi:F0F1-type ATP synthase delta subunit